MTPQNGLCELLAVDPIISIFGPGVLDPLNAPGIAASDEKHDKDLL